MYITNRDFLGRIRSRGQIRFFFYSDVGSFSHPYRKWLDPWSSNLENLGVYEKKTTPTPFLEGFSNILKFG